MLQQLSPPGGPDLLDEVLHLFASDAPVRLAAVTSALDAGDAEGAGRAAHALKGAAGNIGARDLHAACKTLEDCGRGGQLADSRAALEAVQAESRRVLDAIARRRG